MTFGSSIFLIAVGAILRYAVTWHPGDIKLDTAGLILMIVGSIGLILSLVWMPGQFSPPHAHQTWCAYAVCDNTLTETEYAFDRPSMKALPLRTVERHAGYCTFGEAGLDQIHRLGNAGVLPAISLHVYGIESGRIGTHVNRKVDAA